MTRRMIVTLVAAAAFVAAIGTVKFFQVKAAIAQASSFQPPPEAVTTVIAPRASSGRPPCPASAPWWPCTA